MRESVQIVKQSRGFGPFDALVLAISVMLLLAAVFAPMLMKSGESVTVTAPDYYAVYPLDTDRTLTVSGVTLRIQDGAVSVVSADCPDKCCEKMGKITKQGQAIVCSPQAVVIRITGDGGLDGWVG